MDFQIDENKEEEKNFNKIQFNNIFQYFFIDFRFESFVQRNQA